MEADAIPPFEKFDLLLVLLFSALSAVGKEIIGWYFVYRKDEFKKKHSDLCRAYHDYAEAFVKFDGSAISYADCAASLAFHHAHNEFKTHGTTYKIVTGGIFMLLMLLVMSFFEGRPVAKLPFELPPICGMITKNDIPGADMTECSATFLYTVVSLVAKDAIQVLLGYYSPVSITKGIQTSAEENERRKRKKQRSF